MNLPIIRALSLIFLLAAFAGTEASPPAEEQQAVSEVVKLYLHGTSFNEQEDITRAFHANARLYLDGQGSTVREMSGTEYARLFPAGKRAQFNGRVGRLKVQARRNHFVLEGQDGFDQAGDAGRGI